MIWYPFDDDPSPWRERPMGSLAGIPYARTTAAARALREFRPGHYKDNATKQAVDKRRRDMVIQLLVEVGLSNREIARVLSSGKISEAQVRAVANRLVINRSDGRGLKDYEVKTQRKCKHCQADFCVENRALRINPSRGQFCSRKCWGQYCSAHRWGRATSEQEV